MSRYVTWLHISDLHLCSPTSDWQSDKILLKLREDLQKLEEQEGLRPDFVFVTGDVAFGHINDRPGFTLADQYDEATLFLQEVLSTYKPALPVERLFVVPGNHDVHRKMVLESMTAWLDSQRESGQGLSRILKMLRDRDAEWRSIITRLDAYREFLDKKLGARHLLTHPEHLIYSQVVEVQGVKFGIAGLNSAWSCVRNGEKGSLWLGGDWQVNTLERVLRPADVSIALMHHPPNWFGADEDPSVGRLIEGTFHFFLHGHEHLGWIGRGERHVRIAAGAAYATTDAESGYNIVRLDLDAGSATVWLRRYSSQGKGGWVSYPIPDLTDDSGRKKLLDLPFLPRPQQVPPPAAPAIQPPQPAVESEPPLPAEASPGDGAASRGVYGRDAAIQDVSDLLSRHAVVAVYGMSGIGKTTLIHEVARTSSFRAVTFRRLSADNRWTMADLYGQIARLLGNRDEHPEPPPLILGKRDWSSLRRGAQPALILIEHAHLLFDANDKFHDPNMGALLLAIAENAPKVRVVLECRTTVSNHVLGADVAARFAVYRVKGLDASAVTQFFRRPYPDRPAVGWNLTPEAATHIAGRLGSEKQGGAHPLAMGLLAALAEGLGQRPEQVLDRHAHVLRTKLEEELFRDLFENALSTGERTVLGLCALYRDEIPLVIHANALNAFANDENAFQGLERRCLLTAVQSDYFLHALVRDLALSRLGPREKGHTVVGDAWIQTVKQTPSRSPERYRAASEAVFHLLQAEQYQQLAELKHALQRRGDILTELEARARYLYQRRHTDENRTVLEILIALDPGNHKARSYLGECLELLCGKGNPAALEQYEEAHRLDPTSPRYLAMLGRALLAQNKAERFLAIIEGLPEPFRKEAINEHVVFYWSNALHQLERDEDASRLRMAHIHAGSRQPRLFVSEARWLHSQGQSEQALHLLVQAEKRGIADDYTCVIKTTILEGLGRGEEGSTLRQARIRAGSRHSALYVSEARWLHGQGRSEEALTIISQAGQRGMCSEFTLKLEASILDALGRREEASALRRRRIDAGDHNPDLYFSEVRWLHDEGRSEEALALLAQARQRGVASAPILNLETAILEALGRGEEASALRRRQIDTGHYYASLYFNEAKWLHSQGRSEEALSVLHQAEQRGMHNAHTLMLEAAILDALGRGEEASAKRKSRIAAGEQHSEIYLIEARWLHGQGKSEEALAFLARAEDEGATSDRATRFRIRLLEELGRKQDASTLRRRRIAADDRNPHLYVGEAEWLRGQGQLEEALALLHRARQLGIESDNSIFLTLKLLEESSRWEEASALRRKQIDAGHRNPVFYLDEARWLQSQGRSEEALALLNQAEQRRITNEDHILLKSKLLEELNRGEEASALRRSRIDAGSRSVVFYGAEARWLQRQERFKEALGLLDRAEQRGIAKDYTACVRANVLEDMGQLAEASALRRSRIEAGSYNPGLFSGEAGSLHRQGRSEEALALLAQAEKRGISSAHLISLKTTILEAMGRSAETQLLFHMTDAALDLVDDEFHPPPQLEDKEEDFSTTAVENGLIEEFDSSDEPEEPTSAP